MNSKTYSDQFCDWLLEQGYTTCFFVSGGNIMHMLNSARNRFKCIPVVHEVTAVIATEYFNESSSHGKAFSLVTAGPGLTNSITGIAGAWLESRELLVIGGQVKSTDLKINSGVRQNGIQEIDGISLISSIVTDCIQIKKPISKEVLNKFLKTELGLRPGPKFIEFCLDAQGSKKLMAEEKIKPQLSQSITFSFTQRKKLTNLIEKSERPTILIGGGMPRNFRATFLDRLTKIGVPVFTTWNGADRLASDDSIYFGRPNTWGQRSANVTIQQSDLILAFGTRLGLQQTGFNRNEFAPLAKIVQFDVDKNELRHNRKIIELGIRIDACHAFPEVMNIFSENQKYGEWLNFAREVKNLLPNNEITNSNRIGFINPYDFVEQLSQVCTSQDVIIPCSSGGAFTTMMQAFNQKAGQTIITNKGLASMGYGLAGAIGASYANPKRRVILVEGDGGFAQNAQDVGTAKISNLPIKIFLFENNGYASIRMTQKNYFNGDYVGCDSSTGLALPDWEKYFNAFGVECIYLNSEIIFSNKVLEMFEDNQMRAFLVKLDPDQTFFPKITSRVLPNGAMESNPIHMMTPQLPDEIQKRVLRYLNVV
jgi:acetolactate synthase-1/2/3 large subunit